MIGSLPPLPPSLDSLDAFSAQLPPLPSSGIGLSGSMVPSQAKRPHDDKKLNPFVDLEVEEDIRDDADILDTEADDDFDDFIDDCEVFTDEEQPMKTPLPDKAPGEVDEHLEVDEDLGAWFYFGNTVVLLTVFIDNDEERFEDNDYLLTAAAISHNALVAHNDMEQWQALLTRAHEREVFTLPH
ncbi:hypothetical protein DXG01_013409 [Tephrocybe rancida]|nr:hypothetical protein DXG01_013409 [Tephrocybe rancida]